MPHRTNPFQNLFVKFPVSCQLVKSESHVYGTCKTPTDKIYLHCKNGYVVHLVMANSKFGFSSDTISPCKHHSVESWMNDHENQQCVWSVVPKFRYVDEEMFSPQNLKLKSLTVLLRFRLR